MKKYYFYIPFFLCCSLLKVSAQTPVTGSRPAATPVAVPAPYGNTAISFIRTWEPSMPTTDPAVVTATARTVAEVKQSTQYIDGLGRPVQTVNKGITPLGKDIVAPVIYDAYGRMQYNYLPYAEEAGTGTGAFKTDAFGAQKAFYESAVFSPGAIGESVFYSQIEYDQSPLNRVLKMYSPGNSWAKEGGSHPVENQYSVNTVADSVRIWITSSTIPSSTAIYPAGTLFKNVGVDESGNTTVEYKNQDGQLVMKKMQSAAAPGTAHMGWLCTYYVYDDVGNLRFVIPPLAVEKSIVTSWNLSAVATDLCFQFQYDNRNRVTVKRVPGAGDVYFVYDLRDRPVFIQDAVQRSMSPQEWLATFYDGNNRPVMTAIYKNTITQAALQTSMNSATSSVAIAYTFPSGGGTASINATNALPGISIASLTPLSFMFFDNYNYTGSFAYETTDLTKLQNGNNPYAETLPTLPSNMTNGFITGSKVRVLDTDKWLSATTYYNDKGRVTQVVADNNVGGKDVITNMYDFNGKVLSNYFRHNNPRSILTPQTTLLTMFEYDHAGRLMITKKRLNDNVSQEQTVGANSYDELGSLKQLRLGVTGSASQLDSLSYTYNIRGWLQGINKAFVNTTSTDNWFGLELNYDYGFSTNQYNGNISGSKWKSKSDGIARAYGFNYDKINRLTAANFTQQNTGGANWTNDKVDFSVNNISYDANGNINTMKQQGLSGNAITTVDQLTYSYQANSNKLLAVADPSSTASAGLGDFTDGVNTGNDYSYDGNGSLITDKNKGISVITYNYLNLPVVITVPGKGSIAYQYDAAGNKLKKTVNDITITPNKVTVTDYISGFVYEQDTLKFLPHEEGRIRAVYKTGEAVRFTYDYFEKDQLGNVRVVLTTQNDSSKYAATMETSAAAAENALFSNIDNTRAALPAGYPADNTTSPNTYVAKLNGVNGQKIGPSLVLRVMAGDTIQLGVKAFYKSTGTSTSVTTTDNMLAALLQAFSGGGISEGAHNATGTGSPIATSFSSTNYNALKQQDPAQNLTDKPKAYLNYALFDDRFNMVNENSGVKQVQGSPDELQTLGTSRMVVKKTGFLYIYTTNESGEDVFFDNLVVAHNSGPLMEETHYYPFGLTMAGISSGALKGSSYKENKIRYNGKELQNKEFSDGSGLELYDYGARMYNAQIGRWNVIDPHSVSYGSFSPYIYVGNSPLLLVDPNGKDWFYHSKDSNSDPEWNWHDGNTYKTGVNDENGKEVELTGVKAVVVFNGSRSEKLGEKDGKSGYINGEGAVTASVTVYGPKGANDVHSYTGYTMGSNADKFGAVDEGTYDANYDAAGKSGSLKSNWTLNSRGHIRMMDGSVNPNAPDQLEDNGEGYKDGIFIHSSNQSGFAGEINNGASGISVGCLLIVPTDWKSFNDVMDGVKNFKVQVIRDVYSRTTIQGVFSPISDLSIINKVTKKD